MEMLTNNALRETDYFEEDFEGDDLRGLCDFLDDPAFLAEAFAGELTFLVGDAPDFFADPRLLGEAAFVVVVFYFMR